MRRAVVSFSSPQARALAGDVVLAGSGGSLGGVTDLRGLGADLGPFGFKHGVLV